MARTAQASLSALMARWVDRVVRYPRRVAVLVLLLSAISGWYAATRLGIRTDPSELLAPDLPFRRAEARLHERFPWTAENIVAVVEAESPERARAVANELSEALRADPLFTSVDYPPGEPFFQQNGLLYESTAELRDLAAELDETQPLLARLVRDTNLATLAELLGEVVEEAPEDRIAEWRAVFDGFARAIRAGVEAEPGEVSWENLMRGDAAPRPPFRQIVTAVPHLDHERVLAGGRAMDAARRAARALEEPAQRVRLTGSVALGHEELKTVLVGARAAGLLAVVLVTVVLGVGLRSARLIGMALLSLMAGLSLTAAFAALSIGYLNLISIAFAVLYVGLGIDYAIHLLLRHRELRQGRGGAERVRTTGRDMAGPLGLCAVTTALGFFAFLGSAYRGVSELGLIAGASMFISFAVSMTLLPALLMLFPPRGAASAEQLPHSLIRILSAPARHPFAVRIAAGGLCLGALVLVPLARFDHNPLRLRDPRSESVMTLETLLEENGTQHWNAVALAEGEARARALVQELEGLDTVDRTLSIFDFVPDDQDEKLALIDEIRLILGPAFLLPYRPGPGAEAPETLRSLRELEARLRERRAAEPALAGLTGAVGGLLRALDAEPARAEALLDRVEARTLGTFPAAMEQLRIALKARPVTMADIPADLLRRWVSPDGFYQVRAVARENLTVTRNVRAFVEDVTRALPGAAGAPVGQIAAADAIVAAFRRAVALALLGIGVVLLVVLRRARLALTVLVPVVMGGLLTAASMPLVSLRFTFANIIALPLLLGIGVDSGVHMVQRARRIGAGGRSRLLETSTTRAVIFSALTTICGFGSLTVSPHPGTAGLGLLLTLGVGLMLLSTLVILPAFLPETGHPPHLRRGDA